jgi:hypothetical protein
MKFLFAIVLPLYALDQITKWATIVGYEHGSLPRVVIPPDVFELVYWQNTEAAFSFGLFSDPTWNNRFYIALSCIAFVGLIIAWRRSVFIDKPSRWAGGPASLGYPRKRFRQARARARRWTCSSSTSASDLLIPGLHSTLPIAPSAAPSLYFIFASLRSSEKPTSKTV